MRFLPESLRWRWWFLQRYCFLLRTFQNGRGLVQAYRHNQVCEEVVLRDGTCLRHPPKRGGFLQTILEIWHERCYTPPGFYRPRREDVIIDAGANVGLFSIWMARQSPLCRLIALEPFAENFAFLQKNLQAAGLSQVTAYQAALGATSGSGRMMAGGPRSLDHRLVNNGGGNNEVCVVSLKDLLQRAGAGQVALLKMDIEGAERDVFAGVESDTLKRIDRLAIEYHEHLAPGVSKLLQEKLENTHDLTLHPDPGGQCGILLARRRT